MIICFIKKMKNERLIKTSPDPVDIAGTKIILNQMKNCICKIKINAVNGTGFFCKIPYKRGSMNVLMTNYHVLDYNYFKENDEINLFMNDNKEVKVIKLGTDRKTFFDEDYDIAIIEIKEDDGIEKFLDLDENLFRDETKAFFKDISIYILHYPYGKKASVSYGLSNGLVNYEIEHTCCTEHGSSGSPILNLSNNKVIGIHKQGSKKINFNIGTFLKFPLNDFLKPKRSNSPLNIFNANINKINNIINNNINNFDIKRITMFNLFNDMKKLIKPGPKINVIFQTDHGNILNLIISHGVTIGQTLKYYLRRMNREYIGSIDKIFCLYNGIRLKLEDNTPVEIFFQNHINPKINVSYSSNYDIFINNWTEEEENQIKNKLDEILSDVYAKEKQFKLENAQKDNEEKEITVKFNKRGTITKIRISNYYMVAELIDEYYRRTKTNDGIFKFNGAILTPIDTKTLSEVGLKDNSEIKVS